MSAPAATAPAAEAKSTAPTLHYFGLNGRGDYVKVLYEDAGVPYNFVAHTLGGHKSLTFLPFGQLPVLVDSCGHVTAQTGTIVRLVAKRLNQYPSNPCDAARAEAVTEQTYDVIGKYFSSLFGGNPSTEELKTYLTAQYALFEKVLAASESKGEYVTKSFTFADLQLWQLLAVVGTVQAPSGLLAAHFARISARPNIAAYLASSRWIKPGRPEAPKAAAH